LFYTGGNLDYVVAAVVALPLSLIAAGVFTFLIGNFGFFSWFISFIAAPVVGGMIAEAVRWAVRRRRSRYLGSLAAACLVVGVAPFVLMTLISGLVWLDCTGILLFLGMSTIVAVALKYDIM
jgi:LytS/YehU family sensor histidine kinase